MSITRVHHVGLVNGDLDHAKHILVEGFGLAVDEHRTPLPGGREGYEGTTILEFPIGELFYEVARPNDLESEPGKYLTSTNGRGGMYYISLASSDMKADVQGIIERGGKLREDWDGIGSVFIDPNTSMGLRVQITPEDNYFVHPYFKGNGTCTGLAHVGIAARNPEESRQFWGHILGLKEDKSEERGKEGPDPTRETSAADDPVHLLEFPVGGTVIEISHPTTTDSGTARLVASRAPLGAVYHHTAPFAPDVYRFVEQAVPAGMEQIGSLPPKESKTPGSSDLAWFHPRSCLGMLLEPWNRLPGDEHYQQ